MIIIIAEVFGISEIPNNMQPLVVQLVKSITAIVDNRHVN